MVMIICSFVEREISLGTKFYGNYYNRLVGRMQDEILMTKKKTAYYIPAGKCVV
jgi:hypothetical protein